jgi:hypothetical protein
MKALCLGALAAAASMAAPAQRPPDPSQADAKVPAPVYRSVFQDTPRGVSEDLEDWKKANAQVGQFPRGHADLLKWEAARQPSPVPAAPHKH